MHALIMKEIRLIVHPTTVVFLALGAMVAVPMWPYAVILLYVCLSVLFNALNARESHDMDFSFPLPVSRADMVRARIAVTVGIEVLLIAIMFVFSLARPLMGVDHLFVGMAPNLAFLGFSLITLALFNIVFFPLYYRDVVKVGVPFLIASVAPLAFGILFEAAPYFVAGFRDGLATPGFGSLAPKLAVFLCGTAVFAAANVLAVHLARRTFERADV